MKNWQSFLLGFISGAFATFVVLDIIGMNSVDSNEPSENIESEEATGQTNKNIDGVTWFDEPGDVIKEKSFKVSQVLSDFVALANGSGDSGYYWDGIKYLLVNKENKYYYDDEIVKVPSGRVVRQVGVFQYETRLDMTKTVPIVMIMDK